MEHSRHTYSGEAQQVLSSEVGIRNFFSETLKDNRGKLYIIKLKGK